MRISISTIGLSLTDFIAGDLPIDKWMGMICPRMRLRVRTQDHDFVSSSVKVDDRSLDETNLSRVCWPWDDDGRPFLAYDEDFVIEVERRFLLRYKCVRRTERVAIDREQFLNGDRCAMPLYDGQMSAKLLEDENRIEMNEITFTLRSHASRDEASSTVSTCTDKVELHEKKRRTSRRRIFWRFWRI